MKKTLFSLLALLMLVVIATQSSFAFSNETNWYLHTDGYYYLSSSARTIDTSTIDNLSIEYALIDSKTGSITQDYRSVLIRKNDTLVVIVTVAGQSSNYKLIHNGVELYSVTSNLSGGTSSKVRYLASTAVEKVNVTFNVSGGQSQVSNLVVDKGTIINKPTDPTKNGYIFDGWFNEETLFDFTKPVTQNLVLTAKWILIDQEAPVPVETYSVTFNLNGGSNPGSSIKNLSNIVSGAKINSVIDPIRPGYEFLGWFTDDATKFDFETPVTKNLVLIAKWKQGTSVEPLPNPTPVEDVTNWFTDNLVYVVMGLVVIFGFSILFGSKKKR